MKREMDQVLKGCETAMKGLRNAATEAAQQIQELGVTLDTAGQAEAEDCIFEASASSAAEAHKFAMLAEVTEFTIRHPGLVTAVARETFPIGNYHAFAVSWPASPDEIERLHQLLWRLRMCPGAAEWGTPLLR